MKKLSKQRKFEYPEIVEGKLYLAHTMILQTLRTHQKQYKAALQKYVEKDIYLQFESAYSLANEGLISKQQESIIAKNILACINASKDGTALDLGNILIKLANALAFLLAHSIATGNQSKSSDESLIYAMRAGEVFGILLVLINTANKESLIRIHSSLLTHKSNQAATRERNVNAAQKRHAQDPKTQEKQYVHDAYLAWAEEPDLYTTITQFSKAMARDCKHLKCSPVTVGRWIKEWKK